MRIYFIFVCMLSKHAILLLRIYAYKRGLEYIHYMTFFFILLLKGIFEILVFADVIFYITRTIKAQVGQVIFCYFLSTDPIPILQISACLYYIILDQHAFDKCNIYLSKRLYHEFKWRCLTI